MKRMRSRRVQSSRGFWKAGETSKWKESIAVASRSWTGTANSHATTMRVPLRTCGLALLTVCSIDVSSLVPLIIQVNVSGDGEPARVPKSDEGAEGRIFVHDLMGDRARSGELDVHGHVHDHVEGGERRDTAPARRDRHVGMRFQDVGHVHVEIEVGDDALRGTGGGRFPDLDLGGGGEEVGTGPRQKRTSRRP